MGPFDGEFPRPLAKVIAHAKRLMKVLGKIERVRSEAWFLGRAGELREVVSLALGDWRAGRRDAEATAEAILAYVDAIHRGASKKLRCGVALECCEADEIITAVAPDEWESMAGMDTVSSGAAAITSGPTAPARWADTPEMLARVQDGLPLVAMHARGMARRVGNRYATEDDLRAFGREGLLAAARAFDEGRGVPFDRWASLRIRNAMIDGMRRFGAIPPRERRKRHGLEAGHSVQPGPEGVDASDEPRGASDTSPGTLLASRLSDMDAIEDRDGLGKSPEHLLEGLERAAIVREIVAKLPDRERTLIERSYFDGLTLEQAAESIGVSRSWAHRVHARAIEIMNRELRKRERPAGRPGTSKRRKRV
jgi:RNA polymerase sigma factor for flagellar operon FliA